MNRNINIYCDTAKDIIPNIDNINISKIKDIINFSVDYIYCGILEHIESDHLIRIFNELSDKIRIGGKLIIKFSDIKELSNRYISNTIDDSTFMSCVKNKKQIISLNSIYSIIDANSFRIIKVDRIDMLINITLERIALL